MQEAQQQTRELTFRDFIDLALVFGGIPALVLDILFWAIATAFPQAGILPGILALLVTLLLSLTGIILIVRYIDVCMINGSKSTNASDSESENFIVASIGAGLVCLFLAIGITVCLSTAGTLEGWHYTLMGTNILLIGYQTWRIFLGRS